MHPFFDAMKLLLSTLLIFHLFQPKQGPHKGYAYMQIISGGAHPVITDTLGNLIESEPSTRKDYFIYLEIKKGILAADSIYIDKHLYKCVVEKIKTPVLKSVQTGMFMKEKPFTLVPRTINTVYRILLQNPIRPISNNNQSKPNTPVIIYYKVDGRRYTKTFDRIIMLPEEIRQ